MAGRWHILAATLPEWLHARKQQLAAIGQWLGNVDAWLGEIIPRGWWNGPLAFLLMLLILVAVCAVPLLIAVGYTLLTKMAVMDWWRERTFGVHGVLWTLLILASLALADRLAMIPNSPMHWLTWWILLIAVAHPVYLLTVAAQSQPVYGERLKPLYMVLGEGRKTFLYKIVVTVLSYGLMDKAPRSGKH